MVSHYSYASEKFASALHSLAISGEPLQVRVTRACLAFSILDQQHFHDPDVRNAFIELRRRLNTRPSSERQGSIQASVEAMTDDELHDIARRIYELAFDTSRRFWQQS